MDTNEMIDDPYVDDVPLAEKIKRVVLDTLNGLPEFDNKDVEIKRIVVTEDGDVDVDMDIFEVEDEGLYEE